MRNQSPLRAAVQFDTLPLISNRLSGSTGFFNQFSDILHESVSQALFIFETQINSLTHRSLASLYAFLACLLLNNHVIFLMSRPLTTKGRRCSTHEASQKNRSRATLHTAIVFESVDSSDLTFMIWKTCAGIPLFPEVSCAIQ